MWQSRFKDVRSITGSASAAVLCTILTQHLSSRQSEVYSEMVCWVLLPFLFTTSKPSNVSTFTRETLHSNPRIHVAYSISLWIVAAGVATACCYKAEIGVIGLFVGFSQKMKNWTLLTNYYQPILTPLLLIAEKHLRSELQASKGLDSWFFYPLANTIWGTALASSVPIFILSEWDLLDFSLSIILVASLLVVYVALIPKSIEDSRFLPLIKVEDDIIPLSSRIVVILVLALSVQTVAFGFPRIGIISTLLLGFMKAFSWYCMIRTVCCPLSTQRDIEDADGFSRLDTPLAIATFSMSATRDPFMLSSEIQALSQVVASFLSLGQIVHMLPKQAKSRSILWTFILVSLVPYLANIFAIKFAQSSALSFDHSQEHPIEALIHNAKADFEHLLQRQSKNYTTACEQYRLRYHAEPPPGFGAWYAFAAENQSPVIDEFDMIFNSISPFWKLSGKEVVQVMTDVQNVPNVDLWLCTFSGDSGKTRCSHPSRNFDRHIELLFDTLLGDLRGLLPDVKFLVNHLDEPRVLTPPQALQRGKLKFTDLTRRSSWDEITKYCASQRSAEAVEYFGLPFVTNLSTAMDLCQHAEYSAMHGILMSPTSFRLIEGLVPILSTGSLSTMGDLLFPSPAYIESEFRYDEAHDIEWEKKENKLYWAGSTTGGFVQNDSWRNYHRQRFVKLAQNLERKQHSYIRERDGAVVREKSSFLNSRLFDIAFTRTFQCERRYCRDQRMYFNFKSWADKDRALRSRLVFDIDGNGISGRYYKLLASKSVPLKQTLFREWHDERLVPWFHYIPVSQSMEEVPELAFYLTSTEAGQKRAKEIAEQGRKWYSRAFRDVDLSIYTYRLLLELARVQDPKRKANDTSVRQT
ncbi:related to capsule-associated protein [Phialocephala subalpina]|uniref:Related to capsule-associated protein n=1 Tax=Phialocephala subalpina TaxID=576137 RepID=A0A1L7WGA4_9HELO|nr:related to capsule-associated protein [Phialocephala subalpina]